VDCIAVISSIECLPIAAFDLENFGFASDVFFNQKMWGRAGVDRQFFVVAWPL